ncbi:sororin [Echeneis naucrates]|uniref:Cell division cycle associated 5 n=1 Tax=Echeneis naucrates TaxID=173247 RepID=A0A665WD30_ECHNA|nr:sororin [Echeneis naucrates]
MKAGTPKSVMSVSNNLDGSLRRRSPRFSSPPQASSQTEKKMAAVKRSIAVRKIAPRKTAAPSEHNKENTPRRSEGTQQKRQKVSTPGPVSGRKEKEKAAMPSPILPSSPPPTDPQQPAMDPEDAVWSQKVRRSYSRLGNVSVNSPDHQENLFGFEKLQTPEVVQRVRRASKTGPDASGSLSCLNSFTSLLEAEASGSAFPEPDPNIPGVSVVKERRRRKKVHQMNSSELDALAAQMNAVFEEAEEFELVVE